MQLSPSWRLLRCFCDEHRCFESSAKTWFSFCHRSQQQSPPQGSTLLFLKHSGHVGRVLGTEDSWVTQWSWHKKDLTLQKGLFAQGVEALSLLLPGNQDAPSMIQTQYLPGRYSIASLWLNCLRRQSLQICFCYKLIQERVVWFMGFVLVWFGLVLVFLNKVGTYIWNSPIF